MDPTYNDLLRRWNPCCHWTRYVASAVIVVCYLLLSDILLVAFLVIVKLPFQALKSCLPIWVLIDFWVSYLLESKSALVPGLMMYILCKTASIRWGAHWAFGWTMCNQQLWHWSLKSLIMLEAYLNVVYIF